MVKSPFSMTAAIDFTITGLDDTGDWKSGIGCTETQGTGPCHDQSRDESPGLCSVFIFIYKGLTT